MAVPVALYEEKAVNGKEKEEALLERHVPEIAKQPLAKDIPFENVFVALVPVRFKYVPEIPPANVEVAVVSPRIVVVANFPTVM